MTGRPASEHSRRGRPAGQAVLGLAPAPSAPSASRAARAAGGPPEALRRWGSECTDCGNATPGSMRCDTCLSDKFTKPLWIEADDG